MDRSNETTRTLREPGPHPASSGLATGVTAAIAWLLCTLAAGAVAAFAAMLAGLRPTWFVLILAVPLTFALRYSGCLRAPWAGAVAALAVLLAGFYASNLAAVARIAAVMGFRFGQAFRAAGAGLILQVAELGLDALSALVYAIAAALAAMVATRIARR